MPFRVLLTLGACLFLPFVFLPYVARADEKPERVPDLIQTVELDAARADVWRAFTTAEGAIRWMAPVVAFDLRSGGTLKTNYDTKAGIDGPGTIVHHLVAIHAPHLVVIQTEAPEGNPFRDVVKHLTGTWRFEALSPMRTRVTLGMHGWPDGKASTQVRSFFEKVNPGELAKLKVIFPDRPSSPERPSTGDAMKRMQRLLGSWDATLEREGRSTLVRRAFRAGPSEKGLLISTSFGPDGHRRLQEQGQVWIDAADGSCRFRLLDAEGGSVAGVVRCEGEEGVVWAFEEKDRELRMRLGAEQGEVNRLSVQREGSTGTSRGQRPLEFERASAK